MIDGHEARRRDLIGKRQDYARAGIPEYWIVDPFDQMITVLTLDGRDYREHGRFASGSTATSILLKEFVISPADVWALETEV